MKRFRLFLIGLFATLLPALMAPTGTAPATKPVFISCTTACSLTGMKIGQTAFIKKPADTSRSSTVTQTIDPDLQFTNVPTGMYLLSAYVQAGMNGGGSVIGGSCGACPGTVPNVNFEAVGSLNGSNFVQGAGGMNFTGGGFLIQSTVGVGDGNESIFGYLVVSSSTTLGITWAQNVSSAGATVMRGGSVFQLTRLQ